MKNRKSVFAKAVIIVIFGVSILAIWILWYLNSDADKKGNFEKDKKRIAFVSPMTESPVWLQAKAGFLQAAEDQGYYGLWIGDENCNIEVMIKEIEIAIEEDIDAVITFPLNPELFKDIFDKLKENNIPLITAGVDTSDVDQRVAYVGSNYVELGQIQAAALYEKVGPEMKIGVIMSGMDVQSQIMQVKQLEDLVNTLPKASIVTYKEDSGDAITGKYVLNEMLDQYPEINAIFVTSGGAVSSYGEILEQRQLTEKVTLIGMDIVQENLDAVKSGAIYGVMSQDFYTMGYLAGQYALEASKGETVPSVTYTESNLVTIDNVDSVNVVDISGGS